MGNYHPEDSAFPPKPQLLWEAAVGGKFDVRVCTWEPWDSVFMNVNEPYIFASLSPGSGESAESERLCGRYQIQVV